MPAASLDDIEVAFAQHRAFIWNLCYRFTGSRADADEVTQDTFVRALEQPPADRGDGWRPWLTRVAMNASRDRLRHRRRRSYTGPWLPEPVALADVPVDERTHPDRRYDLHESATLAFLMALEALTPMQRAVVLLRDVFEYSADETSDALRISPTNVRTTHSRARRALAEYDRSRLPLSAGRRRAAGVALDAFLAAIAARDQSQLERLLASDVVTWTDAGGEFTAALRPVFGRDNVVRLYLAREQRMGPPSRAHVGEINGLPAWIAEWDDAPPDRPGAVVLQCDVDASGHIRQIYTILATRKIAPLRRDA